MKLKFKDNKSILYKDLVSFLASFFLILMICSIIVFYPIWCMIWNKSEIQEELKKIVNALIE